MKKVRITKGYYGYRKNNITRAKGVNDPPFDLPDEEAKRIIDLGIAVYVNAEPVATNEEPTKEPLTASVNSGADDGTDGRDEISDDMDATFEGTGDKIPTVEDDEDIPEYSVNMSPSELRDIAKQVGITFRVGTTKADMVAALDDYYGEKMPDLTAEPPVA